MSQLASDLNNLGLDPNTLKKLSMSGIREFIPPPSGPPNSSTGDTSGSSSPFPPSFSSANPPQRLQPPMGSYGSPRGSPTPSTGSMTSMMPPHSTSNATNGPPPSGNGPPPTGSGPGGQPSGDMSADPSAISTYSDGGTTYFYASDDVVSPPKYTIENVIDQPQVRLRDFLHSEMILGQILHPLYFIHL